jgi:hypothetical protein
VVENKCNHNNINESQFDRYKRHVIQTASKKELIEIVANGGIKLPLFAPTYAEL